MPLKVLHIVESFNGQATESWLLNLLRESNKSGESIDWTFFCILGEAGSQSKLISSLGGRVICSPYQVSKPLLFMKGLREVVKKGKYDVVHSHHDIMSAIYFLALVGLPVRKRIIHIHNTSISLPISNKLKRLVATLVFRYVCKFLSDRIVGVSEPALATFHHHVGAGDRSKLSVIHCGIELSMLGDSVDQEPELKRSLAIPENTKVLLFVGRMIEYKNPFFVLEVLSQLPEGICAVFVGTGPLEVEVRRAAVEMSLQKRVHVLGWRDDVFRIMKESDLLLWPSVESPREGLGLGVVEAQAVGLPVIMSRSVPEEAIVVPDLVTVVPLAGGSKLWAKTVEGAINKAVPEKEMCFSNVNDSSFNISRSLSNIIDLYGPKPEGL